MADRSTVRLVNKSAHLKYIALGGGAETITVPPTEEGQPGIEVRFDTADERAAFERALEQPAVKAWVDAGELVVSSSSGQQVDRKEQAQRIEHAQQKEHAQAEEPPALQHRTATQPAEVHHRESKRDKG